MVLKGALIDKVMCVSSRNCKLILLLGNTHTINCDKEDDAIY
jgi:hypothetical protein